MFTDDQSILAAVNFVDNVYGRLDVLINNAGVMCDNHDGKGDPSMPFRKILRDTFGVNVIGTACLTDAFLSLLRKATIPRIVWVSSAGGSITKSTNPTSLGYNVDFKVYQSSKAAVNMLAVHYAMLLNDIGGKSNAVCPGLAKTKLTGNPSLGTTPDKGAEIIVKMATIGSEGQSATFTSMKEVQSW